MNAQAHTKDDASPTAATKDLPKIRCVRCLERDADYLARYADTPGDGGKTSTVVRIALCPPCAHARMQTGAPTDLIPLALAGGDLGVDNRLGALEDQLKDIKSKFTIIYQTAVGVAALMGIGWAVMNSTITSRAESKVSEILNRELPLAQKAQMLQLADERAVARVTEAHEVFAPWPREGRFERKRLQFDLERLQADKGDRLDNIGVRVDGDQVGMDASYTLNPDFARVVPQGGAESYEYFNPHGTDLLVQQLLEPQKKQQKLFMSWRGGRNGYAARLNIQVPRHASHLVLRSWYLPEVDISGRALAVPMVWYRDNEAEARNIVLSTDMASNNVLRDVDDLKRQEMRQKHDPHAFVQGFIRSGKREDGDENEILVEIARPPLWNASQSTPTQDTELVSLLITVTLSIRPAAAERPVGNSSWAEEWSRSGKVPLLGIDVDAWRARSDGKLRLSTGTKAHGDGTQK